MNDTNKITNLADPTDDKDATNKLWVESQIPKGLYHLVAYVKGSLDSHTVEYKSDNVQSVTYRKVGNDKQLIFSFKNDLPDRFFAMDFEVRKTGNDTTGVEIYLHGEAGLSGTNAKTLYIYWSRNRNSNGENYSVAAANGQSKRFFRMYGTNIQIHGGFELKGNHLYNHGKPFSINIGGGNGETYELMQTHFSLHSSATGSKHTRQELAFVFEPDHNHL